MDARVERFIVSVGGTVEDFEVLGLHVTFAAFKQDNGHYGNEVPIVTRGNGIEVQVVGSSVVKAMIIRRHMELRRAEQNGKTFHEYTNKDFEGGAAEASQLGWEAGSKPPAVIGVGGISYKYYEPMIDAREGEVLGWKYLAINGTGALYQMLKIWND